MLVATCQLFVTANSNTFSIAETNSLPLSDPIPDPNKVILVDLKNDKFLLETNNIELDFKLFPLFITISHMQPITVQKLSNFLGRPHSTISRQIQRLEAKNLVKIKTNNDDSRSRIITLSLAGETLSSDINIARFKTMEQVLSDITEQEEDTIIDSLKLLNKTFLENTSNIKHND